MSTRETREFEVEQAADILPRPRIMAVTVASIAITALALVVAWALLQAWGRTPYQTVSPPVAPRTIGTLEQSLILDTERGIALRREQEAALRRWEWVDRDAGIARLPIEIAIDEMAAKPLPPEAALADQSRGSAEGGTRERPSAPSSTGAPEREETER